MIGMRLERWKKVMESMSLGESNCLEEVAIKFGTDFFKWRSSRVTQAPFLCPVKNRLHF